LSPDSLVPSCLDFSETAAGIARAEDMDKLNYTVSCDAGTMIDFETFEFEKRMHKFEGAIVDI
jgi:hypothetical protein